VKDLIEILANIASILTAFIAVIFWVNYKCEFKTKMEKLETYLKNEKLKEDKGQRSILHLVANVGLTESEIIQASFKSGHIKRRLVKDSETGLANSILLEYVENSN
jgi:hypothetical protein